MRRACMLLWLLLALAVTRLPLLRSLCHQDAVIVLGMLEVVFRHDPVACRSDRKAAPTMARK